MSSWPAAGAVRHDHVIARYWRTLRHLRPRQVLARIRLRLAARTRRFWPAAAVRVYERRMSASGLHLRSNLLGLAGSGAALRHRHSVPAHRGAASAPVAAIARGHFDFLNDSGELGWPPDWAAASKPQLWRYHLHYIEYLVHLSLSPEVPSSLMRELMEDWVDSNPVHGLGATRDAWHPYVVSLRLVNWMLALSAMGGADAISPTVNRSLVTHALFLERNLETDVGGNHLLKNLKALTAASQFWAGPLADRWRQRFGTWFVAELGRQILADGGHYERSPMYHCDVLQDAIEVAALGACDEARGAELRALIGRMDQFLAGVIHPDGEIALFNDSAFQVAVSPGVLRRAAARLAGLNCEPTIPRLDLLLGSASLAVGPDSAGQTAELSEACRQQAATSSGYVALPSRRPDRFLLADVGAVCPDDLPAHAHADMLSFELSVDGLRMIVDSGVGEYAAGPWRDYYRSTRAHNTVMVDGCEQSECWGSFRVGRRASPVDVSFRRTDQGEVLEAGHTGYDHLVGHPRHSRRFQWVDDKFWLVADTLMGGGLHTWTSFCHLHPEARVIAQGDSWIRVAHDDVVLDVSWYGFTAARLVTGQTGDLQGWYADRFGSPLPNTVLAFDGRGVIPASFGYALVPQPSREAPASSVSIAPSGGLDVVVGPRRHRVAMARSAGSVN